MGQLQSIVHRRSSRREGGIQLESFPDLSHFPPEVAVSVLSHLNATDLCLAACVWKQLADNELLWLSLSKATWGYTSAYKRRHQGKRSFKELYMLLDEGTCLFNFDPHQGMIYLVRHNVLEDSIVEIAKFINCTGALYGKSVREYLNTRRDVLQEIVNMQNYEGVLLSVALRQFFERVYPPDQRGEFLDTILNKFSIQFCATNPNTTFTPESVFILCHSLILLSVDLSSPHVKNKMSKREFIKNLRGLVQGPGTEYLGDLYDNVYLEGHIALKPEKCTHKTTFPFERPYGKIFLHM
ncbi:F-box only protein 8 [Desmophyllum pertusum]|uniref:F-box only protein 8 n=1 Tax=Desmophyllum pertusum TaxID=174260 RepID=A0A9W9Y9P5_9CNID|nr:F-box only protein 8 [Desmophyllum pertusum]